MLQDSETSQLYHHYEDVSHIMPLIIPVSEQSIYVNQVLLQVHFQILFYTHIYQQQIHFTS